MLGAIAGALRGELEDALAGEGVPQWARERVVESTQWLGPVVSSKSSSLSSSSSTSTPLVGRRVSGVGAARSAGASGSDGAAWEVAGELVEGVEDGGIEEVARRLQEFWYDLEEEVERRWKEDADAEAVARGHKGRWRRHGKASSGSEGESGTDKDRDRDGSEKEGEKEKEKDPSDAAGHDDERESPKMVHVNHVMDAVEKTVCSLFYDR